MRARGAPLAKIDALTEGEARWMRSVLENESPRWWSRAGHDEKCNENGNPHP
jgi:hypothetical protein